MKITRTSIRTAWTMALAMLAMSAVGAPSAHAWAGDPHVQVIATTYSCGISSTSGWAWYSADNGESGWGRRGNSGTIVFDLWRVPGWGASTLVTLKWGVSSCSQVRYRVVSRPAWGTQAWLGNLG